MNQKSNNKLHTVFKVEFTFMYSISQPLPEKYNSKTNQDSHFNVYQARFVVKGKKAEVLTLLYNCSGIIGEGLMETGERLRIWYVKIFTIDSLSSAADHHLNNIILSMCFNMDVCFFPFHTY